MKITIGYNNGKHFFMYDGVRQYPENERFGDDPKPIHGPRIEFTSFGHAMNKAVEAAGRR